MTDNLPGRRISREALEKIIQRAAELQAGEMDTGESMTEAELLKLGADVGIDGRHLRQALYEQGSDAVPEKGAVARWFGPRMVRAGRVVPGNKATIEMALQHWMTEGEALAIKRRMPDRIVWERQKGFFAEMKRGFGIGGKHYHLARALDITVVVTQLESGFCHVELAADVSVLRSGAMGAAVATGSAFALLGGAALALASAVVVAPVAVGLGSILLGAMVAAPPLAGRMQKNRNTNMQLALEQVLDRLEAGEIKPKHQQVGGSPFMQIAEQIRGAITDGIEQSKKQRKLGP